jgi:hypothetical protein
MHIGSTRVAAVGRGRGGEREKEFIVIWCIRLHITVQMIRWLAILSAWLDSAALAR